MGITRLVLIASSMTFSVWTLGRAVPPIDTLSVVGVAIGADGKRVSGAEVKLVAQASGAGELAHDRTSAMGVFNLYATNIGGAIGDLYVVYAKSDFDVKPLEVRISQADSNGWIDLRPGDLVFKGLPAEALLSTDDAADQIASTMKTQAVLLNAGLIDQKTFDATVESRSALIRARIRAPEPTATTATTDRALTTATAEKMKDFKIAVDPAKIAILSGRAGTAGRAGAAAAGGS
ncbi:MAG TPA: hypothetical protein VFV98_10955 [Vicinamibacterales bacterium]|nr:hypothetical protein [Vicinamibacterales bacterium]